MALAIGDWRDLMTSCGYVPRQTVRPLERKETTYMLLIWLWYELKWGEVAFFLKYLIKTWKKVNMAEFR